MNNNFTKLLIIDNNFLLKFDNRLKHSADTYIVFETQIFLWNNIVINCLASI